MSRKQGKAGEDRRRYPRTITKNLRLCDPIGSKVVDLSASGMVVTSHEVLTVEKRAGFTIARDLGRARIGGVVRWCRLVKTETVEVGQIRPVYSIGIAFDGPVGLNL